MTTDNEFKDVPWWARPSYVKAMGMAIVAVIAGFLLALYQFGLIGGDDEVAPEDEAQVDAPEDPGSVAPEDEDLEEDARDPDEDGDDMPPEESSADDD
jgi:cell division protein FtsN